MFEDDAIGIPRSLKHRHKKLSRPRCGASPPPADSCARLGLGRRTEDREVIGPQHVALRRDCTVAVPPQSTSPSPPTHNREANDNSLVRCGSKMKVNQLRRCTYERVADADRARHEVVAR